MNYNNNQYPYTYSQQYSSPRTDHCHAPQYHQNMPGSGYLNGWIDFRNPAYIKGAVIGAALAAVLTNPAIQKAIVKGMVGVWGTLQGGVEELKEQIRDVQAEKGAETNE